MGKCRFGASLFMCVGHVVLYIFFAPKNCHIAILMGYLFDYELLCVWQFSVLRFYLPYIAIKTSEI